MEPKGLQIFTDALVEYAYSVAGNYLEEHRLDADTEALRATLNSFVESSFETAVGLHPENSSEMK
jgi:hypothetical protein